PPSEETEGGRPDHLRAPGHLGLLPGRTWRAARDGADALTARAGHLTHRAPTGNLLTGSEQTTPCMAPEVSGPVVKDTAVRGPVVRDTAERGTPVRGADTPAGAWGPAGRSATPTRIPCYGRAVRERH